MTRVESMSGPPAGDDTRPRRGWPVFTVVAIAIVAFFLGGLGGSFQGKLAEIQKNDNASYLPASAESTVVANETAKFLKVETIPGSVVFQRDGGLTDADKAAIDRARLSMASVEGVDADGVTPTQFSTDGTTASVFVPLIAKQDGTTVQGNDLAAAEQDVLAAAQTSVASDLEVLPPDRVVCWSRSSTRSRGSTARCSASRCWW